MKVHDVARLRAKLREADRRAGEVLGDFNGTFLRIGRFLPGSSSWERPPSA